MEILVLSSGRAGGRLAGPHDEGCECSPINPLMSSSSSAAAPTPTTMDRDAGSVLLEMMQEMHGGMNKLMAGQDKMFDRIISNTVQLGMETMGRKEEDARLDRELRNLAAEVAELRERLAAKEKKGVWCSMW